MLGTFILITIIAMFGHLEDFLGTSLLSRPLVLAPLVGLVLGDMTQGIIIGASLELIFMGNIKVGAAIPPDVITGGVLSTAFAIISGKGVAIALTLAVPISILAEMILSGLFVLRPMFNEKFNKYAEEANYKKMERLHIISGLFRPLCMGIITFLTLLLGADAMKIFLNSIPDWVNSGLQVAANVLPALGFALLMNVMFNKKVAPYFFLGFLLTSYLKLPMIAIGALGIILAIIITSLKFNQIQQDFVIDEEQEDNVKSSILQKNDIRKMFFRSLAIEANFNFEKWQNTGFVFSIIPILKRLYKTKEEMSSALKRHLEFFNTSPHGSTLILGIVASMEEKNSNEKDFNVDSINSVKLGLMGPLAGVFDSFFWGTLKVIAASIGISLALKGYLIGPILFVLIFNLPHFILRYNLAFIGYNAGNKFLQNLSKNNFMDKLTFGASILGMIVVGAMPALLMNISTPLKIGSVDSSVSLQTILNQIAPNIIPLALTFLMFFLVKKNVKTAYLILVCLLIGFIGNLLGVFN